MNLPPYYFARTGRVGLPHLRLRAPELAPLSEHTVALFGLGCIGAPSALEFARSGVRELRILDGDIVDPGTLGRWPIGLTAAGVAKTTVIHAAIRANYPYTQVQAFTRTLGTVPFTNAPRMSDVEAIKRMTEGASLIYDATAEWGVQHFLSDFARRSGIPYIAVDGTYGGWGGKVFRYQSARNQGCWVCYKHACDRKLIIEPPSRDPEEIQPPGCGDPTFTGSGFDLAEVALNGVRIAVSTLCSGCESGYPAADWDVLTIAYRDQHGEHLVPKFETFAVPKLCSRCMGS